MIYMLQDGWGEGDEVCEEGEIWLRWLSCWSLYNDWGDQG